MADQQQLRMMYDHQIQMTQALHDHQVQMMLIIFGPMFGFMIVVMVIATWASTRPKMRMIDVLKTYAERGEEPPPGIIEALGKIRGPGFAPQAPRKQTRADHLAHFAGSIVLALGASSVAWWRTAYGDPSSPLPIIAVLVAIFFFAASAARLVGAVTTRDGDR